MQIELLKNNLAGLSINTLADLIYTINQKKLVSHFFNIKLECKVFCLEITIWLAMLLMEEDIQLYVFTSMCSQLWICVTNLDCVADLHCVVDFDFVWPTLHLYCQPCLRGWPRIYLTNIVCNVSQSQCSFAPAPAGYGREAKVRARGDFTSEPDGRWQERNSRAQETAAGKWPLLT